MALMFLIINEKISISMSVQFSRIKAFRQTKFCSYYFHIGLFQGEA